MSKGDCDRSKFIQNLLQAKNHAIPEQAKQLKQALAIAKKMGIDVDRLGVTEGMSTEQVSRETSEEYLARTNGRMWKAAPKLERKSKPSQARLESAKSGHHARVKGYYTRNGKLHLRCKQAAV